MTINRQFVRVGDVSLRVQPNIRMKKSIAMSIVSMLKMEPNPCSSQNLRPHAFPLSHSDSTS